MEKRKYHLIVWDEVKKSIHHGGLGFRSLMEVNVTL